MTVKLESESDNVREDTVDVLLTEFRAKREEQFRIVDGLDSKGGIIFGAASLVVGLMAVAYSVLLQEALTGGSATSWMAVVLGAVITPHLVLYICIILCLKRAVTPMTYHLPPRSDLDEIREYYLPLTEARVKEQLLADYIQNVQKNWTSIRLKANWVRKSLRLLAADVIYLTTVISIGTLLLPILSRS